MAQHDYDLTNAAGAAFRSDLNAVLAAIRSQNSGASEPATTFAYMPWADTASGWLKIRNAANSAWIKVAALAGNARVDVASAGTIDLDAAAVNSDFIRITGTTGVTAVTLAEGQRRLALAAAAFTLTHSSSLVLPNSANYTTTANDLLLFIGGPSATVRVLIFKQDGSPVAGRFAATVGVGGATPSTSGAGVSFPATQSASSDPNTLDDYEEGSWTPVLTFATPGDLAVTYSTQVGRYTKIGNLVTVFGAIVTSAFTHTTASGTINITGLPFAHETLTGARADGACRWQGITKSGYSHVYAEVSSGGTLVFLQASGSGQAVASVTAADMPSGGSVIVSFGITYRV